MEGILALILGVLCIMIPMYYSYHYKDSSKVEDEIIQKIRDFEQYQYETWLTHRNDLPDDSYIKRMRHIDESLDYYKEKLRKVREKQNKA